MQPIDLHLVSWYRPKMTELVVKTIHRNTKRENFRLVLLDNGSIDKLDPKETRIMIRRLQDEGLIDETLLLRKNIGLAPARNMLLYEATYSPYFICVDNDCLPPPMVDGRDWVERLVDLMERYEDYAAIACRTQVMIGTGNIYEDADDTTELVDFPWPGGSLRIMRTKETRDTGGWNEISGRGSEERDICAKLHGAGYKTAFAAKIPTLHLFGTRGANGTDRWGYKKLWKPKRSGHTNIHHPVLVTGDDYGEVRRYSGEQLAKEYFDA